MSVNVKENGNLTKVANNVSITQANWNDRGNTSKNTCIKNQPATLKTLEQVAANTDENALAGANAVKELNDSLTAFETVTLEQVKNDNYTIEVSSYPLVYKNGFLVGTIFVKCVNPTTSYSISAKLPNGYYIQGITHYFQVDESTGDASTPRIFMHASASGFGVRGGQAGKTYVGLITIVCGKN